MNESLGRLESLFAAALQLPPAERAAYLDQACADDPALRQRVEALLHAQSAASGFLESVAPGSVATVAEAPVTERSGTLIGPYKLLQQIGEGGMGTVFMAEQMQPVHRKVALKVIKPGMDSRQVVARFEAERQALAMMDHVNIARVFDGGTTANGRPYFVMELVHGVPITRYCDDNHLTPRERLELFVPVCQAIQHAHQKGIIHRDIKPSNVLVTLYDGKPVPKVIDFGVAKATEQKLTERTLFTQYGTMVGTLEYMSPEQAETSALGVDTRSDIYSLGVLLYELLTGSTPLSHKRVKEAALAEILRLIKEEEPPRPSMRLSDSGEALASISAQRHMEPARLTRLVRGELDWIVMKCLEKDRNRRYETANGFAMDVQRYLADEPVLACPPSVGYRLRKFARRNKVALLTAALLAGALVLSVVVLAISNAWVIWERDQTADALRRESDALGTAVANEQKAERQRRRAEGSEAKARAVVKEYLVKVTQSQLLSEPGLQELRRDLLQSALRFYEEYLKEHTDDPTLKAEAAGTQLLIGRVHSDLGRSQEGHKAHAEAERLYNELLQADPENRQHLHGLAQCHAFGNANLGKAIEIWERIIAAEPDNAEYRVALANAYNQLANGQKTAGALAEALANHRKAPALREALVREDPDNVGYRNDLGGTLNNLGNLLDRNQPEAALSMYRRAVEHQGFAFERSPHITAHGRFLAIGSSNVARTLWQLGQRDEALEWQRKVVTHLRRLLHDNPAVPEFRSMLCRAYFTLSGDLNQVGDKPEAATYARLGRELIDRLPAKTSDELFYLARVRAQYAALIGEGKAGLSPEEAGERRREADLAMKALRQAASAGLKQASRLTNQPDFEVLRDRADFKELTARLEQQARADRLARAQGTPAARLKAQQEALAIRQTLADGNNTQAQINLAANLHAVALLQEELGQKAEGEKSLRQALAIREALVKDNPASPRLLADLGTTQITLGNLDWKAGRYAEGAGLWEAGLDRFDIALRQAPEDKTLLGQSAHYERTIAASYAEIGLWEETARHLDKALLRQPSSDAELWRALACLRLLAGDVEGYRRVSAQMSERFGKSASPSDGHRLATACTLAPEPFGDVEHWVRLQEKFAKAEPKLTWVPFYVGLGHYRAGRFDEAIKHLRQVDYWHLSWPVLAAAHHRLGQPREAAKWLARADQWYAKGMQDVLQATELKSPFPPPTTYVWDAPQLFLLHQEARGLIRKARAPDPWMSLLKARAYAKLNSRDNAAQHFQAAVAAAPNDPEIWLARGKLFAQLGRDDDAVADFGKAAALTPKEPEPWIVRGRFFAERGQQAKTDADFARAAALTPEELNRFVQAGWWVVGPYPADLKLPCPPETASDPSKAVSAFVPFPAFPLGSPLAGLGLLGSLAAAQQDWKPCPASDNGTVQRHHPVREGDPAGASVYGLTYVYSPDARSTTLLVGGDPLRVWLNGRLVHESTRSVVWEPDMDRVPVTLNPGRNTLLVRSSRPNGPGYNFRVRVADTPLDRGLEMLQLGLWKEAASWYARGFQRQFPDDYFHWSNYAATLLATGDEDGYRRLCAEMLERAGQNPEARFASDLSRDLCLGSKPVADPARLVQLAEKALVNEPKANWRHHYLALAEYRAGKYKEVVARLTEYPNASIGASVIAMAYHRLGQTEKARNSLDWADEWSREIIENACAQESLKIKSVEWVTQGQILRREAHQLIHGKPPPEDLWPVRHRALVYARLGQADKAEAAYTNALHARPEDAALWTARARFYSERGDHKKAAADLARVAWLTPDDWHDLIEAGSLSAASSLAWNFDKGIEGWSGENQCKASASDGVLTIESTGIDPQLHVSLNEPAGSKVLTIRAKVDVAGEGILFWRTADDAAIVGTKQCRFSLAPSGKNWTEVKLYFTATDRLSGLRLDLPDNKPGTRWQIDSIALGHAGPEQLEKALQTKGDDPRLWIARGRYFAWRGEQKKADADFTKAASLTPDELNRFLAAGWWVAGPFPSDMKTPCPPELDAEPSKPVAAVGSAAQLQWQRAPTGAFGRVELHSLFKESKDLSAYALTYVYSPDERTATLLVGGGDRVRVWLNGKPVHETKQERGWGLDLDRVPVTFRPGRNTLLARVSNLSGEQGRPYLILRVADSPLDRGLALGEFGLWDEASAVWRQLSAQELKGDVWLWARYAAVLLATGDKAAYRDQCKKMQEYHRDWSWSGLPFNIAHACALAPDGIKDSNRLVEMAQKGQDPAPSERWRIRALGSANYRAGRFEECIRRLTEIQDMNNPSNQLFIAMAHHRLDRRDEARKCLTQAEESYAYATRKTLEMSTVSPFPWGWHELVEFIILRGEARALIEGSAPKEDENLAALRARARQFLKGLDRKTAAYDWALAMQPDQPRLWLARGRRLAELKRWKEADADLAKAVELKPDDSQVWAERGKFYAEHHQVHKAAADFNKALELLGDGEKFGNPWLVDRAGVDDELVLWDDVFAQVAKQRPKDWHLWAARCRRFTSRGQWKQAVEVLDKIKELAPHRYESWYFEAPLRLEIGDVEGYRRACRDMLAKYGQTENPVLAEHIVQTCLLAPDAVPDLKPVVRLAERAVTATEKQPASRNSVLIRALADYRSGDYARALDRIAHLTPKPEEGITAAGDYLVQAMSNQRLGRVDAARQALAQAEVILERFPKAGRGLRLAGGWYPCFCCQILHGEAKALIENQQKPGLKK